MKLSKLQLCQMIDHTCLKANAVYSDFERICLEAKNNHFAMVAVNPYPVKLCKKLLEGSDVHVGAAIGFPLGQLTIEAKLQETLMAIHDGADEIDYVINISKVKEHDYDYIEKEMSQMVELVRKNDRIIKVIFENCYLDKQEIIMLSKIARKIKPDYIKTSTGFGTSGAKTEDVALMKQYVKNSVKVKAAGGIRDYLTFKAMVEAGAQRIGTSSSMKIIEEYDKENGR